MVALGGLGPLDFPSKKLRTVPVCRARKLGSWVSRVGRFPTGMPTKRWTQKMITDLQKSICLG